MSEVIIPKDELASFVGRLLESYEVFAPVARGGMYLFERISAADEADLSYKNTRLSPKGAFLPQSERMFEFTVAPGKEESGILKEAPKEFRERVLLGLRPCDAQAFKLVDVNFITKEYTDPWWARRREKAILVGLGCNEPRSTCFCTSTGGGPFSEKGLDVLLYDLGESFLARAVTEKGEQIVSFCSGKAPGESLKSKARELEAAARAKIRKSLPVDKLKEKDLLELFNGKFWEKIEFACINCGTCTFVCPTCWCFDIQDEVYKNDGDRLRNWDSCMFPIFTLHGSGHNPRAQKVQRVRQRFMHKLKYYVDKYGNGVACVGCGRCVVSCPVNIDIRRVMEVMTAEVCEREE